MGFSLSALMFPAGSVQIKILSIVQRNTGCPPWVSFYPAFGGTAKHYTVTAAPNPT
jgi:hypothetical protein